MGRRGAEPDEIDDVQDTERIDDEQGDEPLFLLMTGGVPEREPFHHDSPEHEDDEKREEHAHDAEGERGVCSAVKRRRHWSVERIESVHMSVLYHTLIPCGISVLTMEVPK